MIKMAVKRGQSGIELATFFAFMLMIFIVMSFEAANRTESIQRSQGLMEAENVGEYAATQINIASSVGDGYSAVFYLPFGLTNSNYSIRIIREEQVLEMNFSGGNTYTFPLMSANVTGTPTQGENRIRNENGEIIFE